MLAIMNGFCALAWAGLLVAFAVFDVELPKISVGIAIFLLVMHLVARTIEEVGR